MAYLSKGFFFFFIPCLVTDVGMPKRISKHALSFLIIQTHDVVDSELLRPHHERDIDSKPKKKKRQKEYSISKLEGR
jgi:hypothetical protein